jgi:hypothetical protein
MKVFISWSGPLSHRVALQLREWLPVVLPFVEPWVSSEDIPKGSRWGAELATQFEGTNSGIVCLDAGNLDQPWLNFEAGALSKSVQEGRIHPFLLALEPGKLSGPLSQFQATQCTKNDVKKLVQAINGEAGAGTSLPAERVDRSFEVRWPDLERRLAPLVAEAGVAPPATETRSLSGNEPAASPRNLTAREIKILLAVANAGGEGLHPSQAAGTMGVHPERAQYIMERLEARGLLEPAYNYLYGTAWHLSPKGRALLVEQRLL